MNLSSRLIAKSDNFAIVRLPNFIVMVDAFIIDRLRRQDEERRRKEEEARRVPADLPIPDDFNDRDSPPLEDDEGDSITVIIDSDGRERPMIEESRSYVRSVAGLLLRDQLPV